MSGRSRKYYRIGEVSRLTGVDAHVIRYWETAFPSMIKPRKVSRQRLYRVRDIEVIQTIKKLLHEDGYTIAGAKKRLAASSAEKGDVVTDRKDNEVANCSACAREIMHIRSELVSVLNTLQQKV